MTKRVQALRYRITSRADTTYQIDGSEEFSNLYGRFRLEQDRLTIWPSEDFESSESAAGGLAPYLKAWEVQTDLDCGPETLRFNFDSAEVEELAREETSGRTVLTEELASAVVMSDWAGAHLTRMEYPARPEAFAVSQYVDLAHRRWLRYRNKQEPLPAMAYFFYTILYELGGRSKKGAAAKFEIDKAVLDKLSELSSVAGDADTLRKFEGGVPLARVPDTERAWLEEVVPRLIRRLGEHTAGSQLERIKMTDFPLLPDVWD